MPSEARPMSAAAPTRGRPQSAPMRAPVRPVRKILRFIGSPRPGVPELGPSMESHRYDLELKSEDAVTPFVVKHPVTVQVQVRCLMNELHVVTPLAPLSETDWQCVHQLVTEAPAQRCRRRRKIYRCRRRAAGGAGH